MTTSTRRPPKPAAPAARTGPTPEQKISAFLKASSAPADTGDWRDDAECRTHEDPDLWFPTGNGPIAELQAEEAKQICNTRCAVRDWCLSWSLQERMDIGVWGGLSEQDRRRLHRRKARSYDRNSISAVDHILTNCLEEYRAAEAQGLDAAGIARELGTNATTVNTVRERLADTQAVKAVAEAAEEVAAA